jgi:hypothetical protein
MQESQSGGMEHLTGGLPVVFLKEPCVGPLSVHVIAEQRKAQMGQVNPNLVGSAGVQLALNP